MNPVDATPKTERGSAIASLHAHWPEYLMEAVELGTFMISACVVVALLEHPASAAHALLPDALSRRVLTGIAMGLTAIAIVYSPWGKRSGAHFNPSFTLTFWRLGKVATWDAVFYASAHFIGATAGVLLSRLLLGSVLAHPSVNYVATLPGAAGTSTAFVAEAITSFGIMLAVLIVSNRRQLAPYTGVVAGVIVATYIAVEAPLSGMSMNPARSFGPALIGDLWTALWVYFVAPPLGMLLAAETYLRIGGVVGCAKLHHDNSTRCIFCWHQHGRITNSDLEGAGPSAPYRMPYPVHGAHRDAPSTQASVSLRR